MRREWFARIIIAVLVIAAVAIPLGAWWVHSQAIVIHARMAERGGWVPANLTAKVGEPLRLRLTSDDVLHGFAVGRSEWPPVDVKPGEVTEVTLVFDQPGKYTFYCTRWCGLNHWRMRGTIEVSGSAMAVEETVEAPLYVTLGLDIDAPHQAEVIPERKPSAADGARLEVSIPSAYQGRAYYLAHSPLELWKSLRGEASLQNLSDQEIWHLVALVWRSNTTPQALSEGQKLYAANCAACHGERGGGDGVYAALLEKSSPEDHTTPQVGEMRLRPTDFTDARGMLSASPAHLQGKIIRGGMGTGMPYWGPIFTEEQTWALVAFLYTFQFDLED
jgi:mono/diheme cytochrome c family protein/plastocyanin